MGQNVTGVLHGCAVSGGVDEMIWDSIETWNDRQKDRRRWIEWTQDSDVIGVFVVCQNGGDKGVRDMGACVSVGSLAKLPSVKEAERIWADFAKSLSKVERDRLQPAELWLVETEVA